MVAHENERPSSRSRRRRLGLECECRRPSRGDLSRPPRPDAEASTGERRYRGGAGRSARPTAAFSAENRIELVGARQGSRADRSGSEALRGLWPRQPRTTRTPASIYGRWALRSAWSQRVCAGQASAETSSCSGSRQTGRTLASSGDRGRPFVSGGLAFPRRRSSSAPWIRAFPGTATIRRMTEFPGRRVWVEQQVAGRARR